LNISWTRIAVQDLRAVWDFVGSDNEAAADKIIRRIFAAIEQLQGHPNLGRPGRVSGTRELVIIGTPYIVSYRSIRQEIQILAIVHGARRWPENF
jgi:addiction module RelE/StbE family toxin